MDKSLKRARCIKFESLKICMACNQCDNSDLDIHNAEDKKLPVFIMCSGEGQDNCHQLKPKGSHASFVTTVTGADPGFFLGGGALVSCSTSTPINHIFFGRIPVVLENRRSSQRGRGGLRTPCTLPLDPPLRDSCNNSSYTFNCV